MVLFGICVTLLCFVLVFFITYIEADKTAKLDGTEGVHHLTAKSLSQCSELSSCVSRGFLRKNPW